METEINKTNDRSVWSSRLFSPPDIYFPLSSLSTSTAEATAIVTTNIHRAQHLHSHNKRTMYGWIRNNNICFSVEFSRFFFCFACRSLRRRGNVKILFFLFAFRFSFLFLVAENKNTFDVHLDQLWTFFWLTLMTQPNRSSRTYKNLK